MRFPLRPSTLLAIAFCALDASHAFAAEAAKKAAAGKAAVPVPPAPTLANIRYGTHER